ncbi:hypothetical protein [Acinetobacter sp. MD2]|uniref:hypothetical protein n=1 Tax=Acinetobacter sp. MD2 TaxID=2600066 RepID=UPI002D1EA1DB|nr:hypothetical protein [Acinetobacter sp. MD2]MEB3768368.1 hypothetical protein [Acinetobacter sp. MD2]
MTFDLFQYFTEQTQLQQHRHEFPYTLNLELNALALGKIISTWQNNATALYQEIQQQDPLYIQDLARHLTTSRYNQSTLQPAALEMFLEQIIHLQFGELKQLDRVGKLGQRGLNELLNRQIDCLSGQAEDWVWQTNQLIVLIGSKVTTHPTASIDATIQEFHHMVHSHQDQHVAEPIVAKVPTWSKIVEPVVALLVLGYLYCAYTHLTALH